MFKVNKKGTRTTSWIHLTPYSSVSVVNFEHIIVGWDIVLVINSKWLLDNDVFEATGLKDIWEKENKRISVIVCNKTFEEGS